MIFYYVMVIDFPGFPTYLIHNFLFFLQVMPAVVSVMKEEATLVTLIKPQFEARRSQVCEF